MASDKDVDKLLSDVAELRKQVAALQAFQTKQEAGNKIVNKDVDVIRTYFTNNDTTIKDIQKAMEGFDAFKTKQEAGNKIVNKDVEKIQAYFTKNDDKVKDVEKRLSQLEKKK